jgi:hypothetical protein
MPWAPGYSREHVSTALGLLAFVGFVLAVVGVAAAVTWVVVRLTPSRKPSEPTSS